MFFRIALLRKWLGRNGGAATYSKLVKGMYMAGQINAIDELVDVLCANPLPARGQFIIRFIVLHVYTSTVPLPSFQRKENNSTVVVHCHCTYSSGCKTVNKAPLQVKKCTPEGLRLLPLIQNNDTLTTPR